MKDLSVNKLIKRNLLWMDLVFRLDLMKFQQNWFERLFQAGDDVSKITGRQAEGTSWVVRI